MTSHHPNPAEPWPGLHTTRAAQAAWGDDLVGVARLLPGTLYRLHLDRLHLTKAFKAGDTAEVTAEADSVALEARGDLVDIGASLDLLALLQPPGPYLPDPRPVIPGGGLAPFADELRADAAELAALLVAHDHAHPEDRRSAHPLPGLDTSTDAARDAHRAYLRAEWAASYKGIRIP